MSMVTLRPGRVVPGPVVSDRSGGLSTAQPQVAHRFGMNGSGEFAAEVAKAERRCFHEVACDMPGRLLAYVSEARQQLRAFSSDEGFLERCWSGLVCPGQCGKAGGSGHCVVKRCKLS